MILGVKIDGVVYSLTGETLAEVSKLASASGLVQLLADGEVRHTLTKQAVRSGAVSRYLQYHIAIEKGGKATRSQVLYQQPACVTTQDHFDELIRLGHIKRSGFKTAYVIFPPVKKILNCLRDAYIDTVLKGYDEIEIPKYTTLETFKKSGHIRLPHQTYLLSRFKGECHEALTEQAYVYQRWSQIEARSLCVGVATIGQCEPFWPVLERQTLKKKTLPLRYYDHNGYTLRNEGNAVHSFKRLDLFSRVEAISVWPDRQKCLQQVNQHVTRMKTYLRALGLWFRVLSVNSWLPAAGKENILTYDFQVWLPSSKQWLEVGNVSYNHRAFTDNFDVRLEGGGRPVSTCAGLGLTRIFYALVLQKGLDMSKWPRFVQQLDIDLRVNS